MDKAELNTSKFVNVPQAVLCMVRIDRRRGQKSSEKIQTMPTESEQCPVLFVLILLMLLCSL